jgi:Putative auto-transporter adhesin, head GIN domain
MKKLLTAATALVLTFGAAAQDSSNAAIIKKVKTESPITSLVINNGIRVVLMDDPGQEMMLEGMPASVENILISSSKGEMTISTGTGNAKPAVVYVPASFLKKIDINGPSAVNSYQALTIARLYVTVAGECDLKIQTTGKINVTAAEDYKFVYTSKTVTH